MPHATHGGQAAGKTMGTEEEIVGLPNGRGDNINTGRCCDVETSSEVLMPRGMNQATYTPEPSLRIIDTALLRSGSGSRSAAFGQQDESMSELVASIASVGIIEPIVVRQVEANAFDIVAGERRFTAARLLELRQVPCVVVRCSQSEALAISLTENLQRSDLDPVQKACALRRLLDECALTQQEIGNSVGMSQSAIAHHLRLLSLPQEVRCLISEGALSVGHGKVLAGIADEHEAIDAAKDCVSKNKSVREFEASVAIARGKTDKRAPRGSVRNKREEHELLNGLFLIIKESREERGSGTIEIPFYSQDEKNWLLKALSEHGAKRKTPQIGAKSTATARVQGRPAAYQPAHGAVIS
jgi:ParB family transcriptional regulator, chromosome partitioning protein